MPRPAGRFRYVADIIKAFSLEPPYVYLSVCSKSCREKFVDMVYSTFIIGTINMLVLNSCLGAVIQQSANAVWNNFHVCN